jgi:hypothetical protein
VRRVAGCVGIPPDPAWLTGRCTNPNGGEGDHDLMMVLVFLFWAWDPGFESRAIVATKVSKKTNQISI